MTRRPNVSKTLLENSVSAIFSAIEIHNKPRIPYRYPTVVILILNAWELILKSYIYKIQKDKSIIKKSGDRYPWLNRCLNKVFVWDEYLVYRDNIELINSYRNLVIHAFTNELDEIIFSLINKNIQLFERFLKDFFEVDINRFWDNLILLPIWFSKPFNPVSFLWKKHLSKSFSNEIWDFIQKIVLVTKNLNDKSIDEAVIIPFKLDIINKNKIKNSDIIAKIEQKWNFSFSKESTVRLTTNPSAQAMRPLNVTEIEEHFLFDIEIYKSI